jgi:dihydrofolate synthase/folylpolyglutamate synthase
MLIREKIGEPDVEDPEHKPTVFELMTLLAFLIFQDQNLPWCVLETGLGGRLDATNLVHPEACLITPIELEHTAILGDTIELIATEKAGIIKERVPVFTAELHPDAQIVMEKTAVKKSATLKTVPDRHAWLREDGEANFKLGDRVISVKLPFPGLHQARNAALAATALLDVLGTETLSPTLLVQGLQSAFLPARFEIFNVQLSEGTNSIPVVLDTAHTPASFKVLLNEVFRRYSGRGALCIGLASDKKVAEICAMASGFFRQVTVTNLGAERENFPSDLVREFLKNGIVADLIENPEQAVRQLLDSKPDFLVISGSFYLAGHVRHIFLKKLSCP